MTDKVLFVDDEQKVLNAFRRQLTMASISAEMAMGPHEGLEFIREKGPFAVIVSDLRMPGMDGIRFLAEAKKICPDSVRMILTGNADLQNAIQAVNEGSIFRFMTKPCPPEILRKSLEIGIDQYRLVRAEKDLLDNTLKGTIALLTDLLDMANPEAFGRSARVKSHAMELAVRSGMTDLWRMETAVMLSQIGWVLLPGNTLEKIYRRKDLSREEKALVVTHSRIASEWIENIPRMEEVADIVAYQSKNFDGSGVPKDSTEGEAIPLGARILKLALDYDFLEYGGSSPARALDTLKGRTGWYDPELLSDFEEILFGSEPTGEAPSSAVVFLDVDALAPGMVLSEDVFSGERLLIAKGQVLSDPFIKRLKHFAANGLLADKIAVNHETRTASRGQ